MWRSIILILPLVISTIAIKVAVDKEKSETEPQPTRKSDEDEGSVYYKPDQADVDSYLIPPDPHSQEDASSDPLAPATFLLPPLLENKTDFYYAPAVTDAKVDSDWYPIPQPGPGQQPALIPILSAPIIEPLITKPRRSKNIKPLGDRISLPIPSVILEPPVGSVPVNYKIYAPSEELELPSENANTQFNVPKSNYQGNLKVNSKNPALNTNVLVNSQLNPVEPTLALYLTPPKPALSKYNNPTKLYPKKYAAGFKPIPIPIAQFAEDSLLEIPVAMPAKPFKPAPSEETDFNFVPSDDKQLYHFEKAQQQRRLKAEEQAKLQEQQQFVEDQTEISTTPAEQEFSETNYRYPARNAYPAPLKQAPPAAPQRDQAPPAPAERTEFRMHGMKGPHSYQFGYDTGKGKNRQFRYEERDNDGHVRGHYGYVDKRGKLRVVNYDAHPEHGFHADAPVEKE